MLIKSKDGIESNLDSLEQLLRTRALSKSQYGLIQDEITKIKTGDRGERAAAYHINFNLKYSKNYAVIHDLRIDHGGRVAQIDHLLIGRWFDIFLIESKNINGSLRVGANGEFQVETRFGWKGIASPVEQNNRHIQVLSSLTKDLNLAPKRFGIYIPPKYHNWVLVSPECNISRERVEEDIIKMDMFSSRLEKYRNGAGNVFEIAKVVSSETIMEFARRLVEHHRPATFNFKKRFGISAPASTNPPVAAELIPEKEQIFCAGCGVPLDSATVTLCRNNHKRLGDKILCRTCQDAAPPSKCDECEEIVDKT
jgi:hypothetical protein